ncbi:MAG: hypothetical protein ACLP4R_18970 [Solirubrobacteraceae bacterium]
MSFLTAELRYDPFAELGVEDPYPLYARLRDEAPAYYNPDRDFWALSRFEDVQAAARDWETFSSEPCVDPDYVGGRLRLNSFLDLDPPMHDLLRRIVKAHFTPNAIKELEVTTGAIAGELVGTFVAAGETDLARDFAWGLPLKVTMALLGLPPEDVSFQRDTFELLWQDNRLWIEPAQDAPSRVAAARIHEYFAARLLERERDPTADVLSTIAGAQAAEELEIDVLAESRSSSTSPVTRRRRICSPPRCCISPNIPSSEPGWSPIQTGSRMRSTSCFGLTRRCRFWHATRLSRSGCTVGLHRREPVCSCSAPLAWKGALSYPSAAFLLGQAEQLSAVAETVLSQLVQRGNADTDELRARNAWQSSRAGPSAAGVSCWAIASAPPPEPGRMRS